MKNVVVISAHFIPEVYHPNDVMEPEVVLFKYFLYLPGFLKNSDGEKSESLPWFLQINIYTSNHMG